MGGREAGGTSGCKEVDARVWMVLVGGKEIGGWHVGGEETGG